MMAMLPVQKSPVPAPTTVTPAASPAVPEGIASSTSPMPVTTRADTRMLRGPTRPITNVAPAAVTAIARVEMP